MVSIHKLISAINPDIYCDPSVREEVKQLAKEKGYLKATDKAIEFKSNFLYDYDKAKKKPLSAWALQSPVEKHEILYDSATDGLEPIYFWLLDFLDKFYEKVNKITDSFVSSPGSGHFSEIMGKATQMQQEVSRNMGTINAIIKSILQLIYDMKEFKLRLDPYESYKNASNPKNKQAALLSLKQIWMDKVDIQKGRGSINALAAGELDFATLRDAFMKINSIKNIDKIDLNDRVKRILLQRADEFFKWIDESERSLRQRFQIEKNYLKSQVNSLKLTTRWVKPYLRAAQKLEQKYNSMQAALVTTFNTKILELTLLAESKYDIGEDIYNGILPKVFEKVEKRDYYSILIIEFVFRSIPQRVSQKGDWAFGGRIDIKFTSYALNKDELKVLKEELDKDDIGEAMKLIDGITEESLDAIEKDLEEFLKDDKPKEKEKKDDSDTNPFTALFSGFKDLFKLSKKNKDEKDLSKGIKKDNEYEKVIRSQAIISAREKCYTVFDTYKKAHSMPTPSGINYFESV